MSWHQVWEKVGFFPGKIKNTYFFLKNQVFFTTEEKPGFRKKKPTNLWVLDALGIYIYIFMYIHIERAQIGPMPNPYLLYPIVLGSSEVPARCCWEEIPNLVASQGFLQRFWRFFHPTWLNLQGRTIPTPLEFLFVDSLFSRLMQSWSQLKRWKRWFFKTFALGTRNITAS